MTKKKIKRLEAGKSGSALIMTVVLTVLLSIIAVMFVAVARMDMASTSNIADNKMLDSAVKSIIEIINRELVFDTPGVATEAVYPKATYPQYYDYYDYPDVYDTWLASIEPYVVVDDKGTPLDPTDDTYSYKWRQISDVTGFLGNHSYQCHDVNVMPHNISYNPDVVREYPDIRVDPNGSLQEQSSDADGDGIADSKWFELTDLHTSKGRPIYAAVRVIDNGGMVNINTAHSFDANSNDANKIDGSRQMQINLAGLLKGTDTIDKLHKARCGSEPNDWTRYEEYVIWNYNVVPDGNYLPFDISDELELRYRYCIDGKIISRFEVNLPYTAEGAGERNFGNLYDGTDSNASNPCASNWRLRDWQRRITEPNDCKADRRHLLTSLSLDRIIKPDGTKMLNINDANVYDVNKVFTKMGFAPGVAAQIAVNIIDYRDNDSNVTAIDVNGVTYYGFERPCIYISELAYRGDPCDGNSYAIELYKPYPEDNDPNGWKLFIDGTQYDVNWSGSKQYYVIRWQDADTPLDVNSGASIQDMGEPNSAIFSGGNTILLTRDVNDVNVVVDSVGVPSGWMTPDGNSHSIQRDITQPKCIRRLWDTTNDYSPTLGTDNAYTNGDSIYIQAHPANSDFTNIGQIGMIFRKGAYYKLNGDSNGIIGYNGVNNTESEVRLNLASFQQIFKYLTVIDPYNFHPTDPNYADERRIKGRININTAPAFVLAQLPWVSQRKNDYNDANLAKAIIAYRDKTAVPSGDPNYSNRPGAAGFRSVGELVNVGDPNVNHRDYSIDYYSRDGNDQTGFPDLTGSDGAIDDFEERDLIFARISDLVTVRSDMFTAYILVRIGTDGPQKRYIVILDRSGVTTANNRVAIRAFQLTPEAR